jgi:Zn-dependent M28 family amino/carboxypeptidase
MQFAICRSIADKTGISSAPRSLTLVTAHLDFVYHRADHTQPGDPAASAPGADDNGSGIAGVVEILRTNAAEIDCRHLLRRDAQRRLLPRGRGGE